MSRRWLRRVLPVVIAAVVVAPSAAYAAHTFNDVPADSPHAAGIAYVDGAGITHGCDTQNDYCPDTAVSRGQMATFLYRASGNDPATPPSVNAATVGGKTPAELQGATGAQGPPGTPGTNGTSGTNGTPGTNGTNGVSGYEQGTQGLSGNSASASTVLSCPTVGKKALGGGAKTQTTGYVMYASFPLTESSWQVTWVSLDSAAHNFSLTAYIICAAVG